MIPESLRMTVSVPWDSPLLLLPSPPLLDHFEQLARSDHTGVGAGGIVTAEKGGVAKAEGEGEKEKECTTECKS